MQSASLQLWLNFTSNSLFIGDMQWGLTETSSAQAFAVTTSTISFLSKKISDCGLVDCRDVVRGRSTGSKMRPATRLRLQLPLIENAQQGQYQYRRGQSKRLRDNGLWCHTSCLRLLTNISEKCRLKLDFPQRSRTGYSDSVNGLDSSKSTEDFTQTVRGWVLCKRVNYNDNKNWRRLNSTAEFVSGNFPFYLFRKVSMFRHVHKPLWEYKKASWWTIIISLNIIFYYIEFKHFNYLAELK